MPKRKPKIEETGLERVQSEQKTLFTVEEELEILEKYLKTNAGKLLAAEVADALDPGSRSSAISRGRVLDRLFGKPTEKREQTTVPQINVQIVQYVPPDSEELPLAPAITITGPAGIATFNPNLLPGKSAPEWEESESETPPDRSG